MRNIFRQLVVVRQLLVMCILLPSLVSAQEMIEIGSFSKASRNAVLPAGWQPLDLGGGQGQSEYRLFEDNGVLVVRAESQAAATAIFYPIKIDLQKTPIIQWRWKIENILKKGDAERKDGDDYPARLYIFFEYDASRLSWLEKIAYEGYYLLNGVYPPLLALNYLWANKLPRGSVVPNMYSERVQMFAIRSGTDGLGEWQTEQRNIVEDYLRAFGEIPPLVSGIAIMTDTDNTGEQAVAYYGDIRLLAAPPADE